MSPPAGDSEQRVGRQVEAGGGRGHAGHAAAVEGPVGVGGDGGVHAVLAVQQHHRARARAQRARQPREQALAQTELLRALCPLHYKSIIRS